MNPADNAAIVRRRIRAQLHAPLAQEFDAFVARVEDLQKAFDTEVRVCSARTTMLEEVKARDEKLETALRRLGSSEGFTGAIDASHTSVGALWDEIQARRAFASEALGEQP